MRCYVTVIHDDVLQGVAKPPLENVLGVFETDSVITGHVLVSHLSGRMINQSLINGI